MADCCQKRSTRTASNPKESCLGWIWRRCTASRRHQPCFWRRNTQTCTRNCVWWLADSSTTASYCPHRFVSRSNWRSSFRRCLQVDEKDLFKRLALGKVICGLLWHRYRRNEDFGEGNRLEKSILRKQAGASRKITTAEGEIRLKLKLKST